MKNEALRLFLAMTALILTALLTNPMADNGFTQEDEQKITQENHHSEKSEKRVRRKLAATKKSKATRTFAFFYRR